MFEVLSVDASEGEFKGIQVKMPHVGMIKSGQFALITVSEGDESFALPIADVNASESSVFFIVKSTNEKLSQLKEGDKLFGVRAPLGKEFMPVDKRFLLVCDENGIASCGLMAKQAKHLNKKVCFVCTSSTPYLSHYINYFDELYTQNDCKMMLPYLFKTNDAAVIAGENSFMKEMAQVCNDNNFTAYVFVNSVITDGMGMCGGCRLSVGNETKFACVDGPCFLAKEINFDELNKRSKCKKAGECCKEERK